MFLIWMEWVSVFLPYKEVRELVLFLWKVHIKDDNRIEEILSQILHLIHTGNYAHFIYLYLFSTHIMMMGT